MGKMISCQHVNGNVYCDACFYAKVQLDDGTVCTVRAFPHDKNKWEYVIEPRERHYEAMYTFMNLFNKK